MDFSVPEQVKKVKEIVGACEIRLIYPIFLSLNMGRKIYDEPMINKKMGFIVYGF